MRGRSSLWYRVRVNLIHVPEADRPAQAELEVDYDPWAGYEWPDRAGQLERAPRDEAEAEGGRASREPGPESLTRPQRGSLATRAGPEPRHNDHPQNAMADDGP